MRYYGDEDTPFRFGPNMFMTSTNEMGIKGSSEYGGEVYPADFEPSCNAYSQLENGRTSYKTRSGMAYLETTWKQTKQVAPADSLMHFVKHATNQPLFGLNGMCNHQIRMFDTELSTGQYSARGVQGAVRANIPSISETEMMWSEATGVQVASAFVEKHMIPCDEVRHWTYSQAETHEPSAGGSLEL